MLKGMPPSTLETILTIRPRFKERIIGGKMKAESA